MRGQRERTYVPGWCAVVALSGIVPALAMSAEEEYLVLHILGGVLIQFLDLVVEAFPLCQGFRMLQVFIS